MAAEDNRMQHHPHLREKHTRDADGNLTPRSAFHAPPNPPADVVQIM